ncbi:hypothetical protein [Streptomyces sp. NPDC088350]|uniref:hypothetical protein n=1 Tax=Streptomyces sp. NPDC088350 TaxID=3365854 RepID=UPI00382A6D7E
MKKHVLSYSNCNAGVYELGWAQGEMLSYIHTRDPDDLLYVTKFGSLDGGRVDVEGVLAAIRLTYESNDALRTRYVCRDGRWLQEIMGSGDISVAELSATSPQLEAAEVVALLGPLSPEPGEVPVRVAVVTFEGRPTHVYLAIHHASVDNMGAEIACHEICRRSLGLPVLTSSAWQPHQLVEFETSPPGRALAERADGYHRTRFRDLAEFDVPPTDRVVTPLREYQLTSPAVVVAAQQISRRVNVSALSVTLATYCTVLSARLSKDRFPLALTSGNRFNPKLQMSIAKVAQASSLSVDAAVPTFEEFCRRTNNATLLAYRYGVYDPALMENLYAEMKAEYGKEVFFPYLVNLNLTTPVEDAESRSRQQRQIEAAFAVRPGELRQLLDRGVCGARDPGDGVRFSDLTLDIYEFSEHADMRLRTDLAFFPDADLQNILLSTERLLVEIACGSEENEMKRLVELVKRGT